MRTIKNLIKTKHINDPPNTFLLENALKKLLNIFSVGHAAAYRIDPIFKHIIDCVQLYFTNDFTNIVL